MIKFLTKSWSNTLYVDPLVSKNVTYSKWFLQEIENTFKKK